MNYQKKLAELCLDAVIDIKRIVEEKTRVEFFQLVDESQEDRDLEFYEEFPKFYSHSKHGFSEQAVMQSIEHSRKEFRISGVLLGESFPRTARTYLELLDASELAGLADYLKEWHTL
ncbi:MAG: hypothetical protein P4L51_06315 [Puia sp.]|nr:hypothetical protein [Puia sp.]